MWREMMTNAGTENVRPNRMSRQKQKTRNALVKAALSVMARKGTEAATISDITEAADVGFGSFYNHFASKDEILSVVTEQLLDSIGKYIDDTIKDASDPLETLATALRLFIAILISKPEWAQFIIRISATPNYKQFGIFKRLFRDIEKVSEISNSKIVDPGTVNYAIGGAMLFMVVALLEGDLPSDNAPNRIAAAALRILGQKESAIEKLIAGPLPKITKISLEN
jgi:AcrR family transcriptional regulator